MCIYAMFLITLFPAPDYVVHAFLLYICWYDSHILCFSVCHLFGLCSLYRADSNLVITIQDTTGFVRAENVNSVLATVNIADITFLPAQRYGKSKTSYSHLLHLKWLLEVQHSIHLVVCIFAAVFGHFFQ